MDSLGTHRLMGQIFEHLKTEQNLLKHLFQLGGQLVLSSFIFATVCIGGGGNVSPTKYLAAVGHASIKPYPLCPKSQRL